MLRGERMPNSGLNWKFHQVGGLDQVTLRTPEELLHLNELDPKLWVALSCPIDKLQFDARTLELLDADKDGRIRIQEVLDAVRWTVDRLSDPALLAESRPELALEEIRQDTDEGRLLYSTASRILTQSEKEGPLTQEDVTGAIDAATQTAFNGDGVMTPHPSFDPDMNRFIEDIVATTGGATDAGGQQGAHARTGPNIRAQHTGLQGVVRRTCGLCGHVSAWFRYGHGLPGFPVRTTQNR